ncbi:hypothetical protein CK203_055722 [Vitis vinifera]|uniref:Uncharacterized protein n=1 Tax=Vitis vinifera TaxID=29760 RepID=A0A438FVD2_VITVI|nr:hypothetical protein CK203_055722 [Vitis vinifera]
MARTRGAKSSSPSSRKRVPREAPVQGPTSEPPRPEAASPPAKPAPQNPPARRYLTRALSGTIFGAVVRASGGASGAPAATFESQIPSGIAPEVLIRRPMLTQPPIEGNLDCRARPFHSELCFDTATFKLRPELADSFHLLRRYRMEHLLTPRDFFYPRVAMDFYQSMTTNQLEMVHILSRRASTNPHLLRRELPPSMFLIDALLHSGASGYPSDPQLERKRICREVFTLDKWTNMTAYRAEQPELHSQLRYQLPGEHLQIIYLRVYPLLLLPYPEPLQLLQPHQSPLLQLSQGWPFPFQSIEIYAALQTLTASQSSLAQEMAAIRARQEQMLTTQAQHTAILRQLQHHLGLPSAAEHLTPPLQCHTHRPQSLRPLLNQLLKRQSHLPKPSEVPLPPYNFNHPYHIEDNAQLGWGGGGEK